MTKQYTLKGINEDHDTCEVCGKTDLQKVMWLSEIDSDGNESGDPIAAGTTCGAKLLGLRLRSHKKIQSAVKDIAIRKIRRAIRSLKTSDMFCTVWINGSRYKMPKSIAYYAKRNNMQLAEACKMRKEMYPILRFEDKPITSETINEALGYI